MPKGGAPPKVRGSYSSQACTICRSKKSKCDGVKPVCGSCEASGRANECVWGKASASRKPRTEAHFEALRRRGDLLEGYVERLEAMLAKCVCQDTTSHVQFRPPERPAEYSETEDSDIEGLLDSDEEIAQELQVGLQGPIKHLTLIQLDDRSGGLLLHGITAPVRFDSQTHNEVSQRPEIRQPDTSYILFVDSMDIAHCHPNIEWSRHLPPEVSLDRREHDKILALAFKFFTVWCLRVVPTLFLRDMYRALSIPRSQPPPRTPNYSPMLHNAILSICAVFSDNPYIRDPKTRELFATKAKASLETECQKPTICLVPALAFIGSYHADAGDRILADLFFGMSTKISMDLGLAVDCAVWVKAGLISHEEMLIWLSQDVAWALYFGRDFFGAPADRRTIPMPYVDPDFDQLPWYHAPAKIPPQPNYLTLIFFQSSSLFVIARKIIDILNHLATTRQDFRQVDEQITKIEYGFLLLGSGSIYSPPVRSLELHKWKSDLPAAIDLTLANKSTSTPQRLMLHCQYWWCFIVLHRPFFNRRSNPTQVHLDGKIDHVKLCLRAAENIMEVLETWSQIYTLGLSPMPLVQIIFGAGTVFLLRALQSTASPRIAHGALKTALAQVEQCIKYMREMGRTFRSSTRIANMMQALLNDKLRPILARRLAQKGMPISAPGASSSSAPDPSSSAPGPSSLAPGPPQSSATAPGPSSSSASTPESHLSLGSDGERLTTDLTSAYAPAYDPNHRLPTSVPVYPSWTNTPHVPSQNVEWSRQQNQNQAPQTDWSQQSQTATSSQNDWSQQTPTTWDFITQYSEGDHGQSGFQQDTYSGGEDSGYPELDPDMSAFMGLPGFDRLWAQDAISISGNFNVRPPNLGFPPIQNNNYVLS
ncbi:hypothetical protein C8F04DRAFT_1289671 [Mycena alexandri]|uniref:Zn(2)-C6 fungal-type domain-containing protein n=1 Tax=Mycena alexandri TaxID=1745969 RepID=A0AAD6WXT4_9AGAR|nr:hypothetical protein C8F04DRAFT_1289671 [Mycena alexandri]